MQSRYLMARPRKCSRKCEYRKCPPTSTKSKKTQRFEAHEELKTPLVQVSGGEVLRRGVNKAGAATKNEK